MKDIEFAWIGVQIIGIEAVKEALTFWDLPDQILPFHQIIPRVSRMALGYLYIFFPTVFGTEQSKKGFGLVFYNFSSFLAIPLKILEFSLLSPLDLLT